MYKTCWKYNILLITTVCEQLTGQEQDLLDCGLGLALRRVTRFSGTSSSCSSSLLLFLMHFKQISWLKYFLNLKCIIMLLAFFWSNKQTSNLCQEAQNLYLTFSLYSCVWTFEIGLLANWAYCRTRQHLIGCYFKSCHPISMAEYLVPIQLFIKSH